MLFLVSRANPMSRVLKFMLGVVACVGFLASGTIANAYTANKVWFEHLPDGLFRVYVTYTVPALKEFRQSYVDFVKRDDAAAFYFELVRGADFHPSVTGNRRFQEQPLQPHSW